MFEKRKVRNAAITLNGVTYSAPELQWLHDKTVRVSHSDLYPRTVVVFEANSYSFVCFATTEQLQMPAGVLGALAERIERRRNHTGPVSLRAYALDEWVGKIQQELADAERHISYGNKVHAMNSLLHVAGSCVECLQHHIDKEAEKMVPAFQEAIDIQTADPAGTESAA